MIIQETVLINGRLYTHTYSTDDRYIVNENGENYIEAYDVVAHSYTEGEVYEK